MLCHMSVNSWSQRGVINDRRTAFLFRILQPFLSQNFQCDILYKAAENHHHHVYKTFPLCVNTKLRFQLYCFSKAAFTFSTSYCAIILLIALIATPFSIKISFAIKENRSQTTLGLLQPACLQRSTRYFVAKLRLCLTFNTFFVDTNATDVLAR